PATIEEMAARYLSELRVAQPNGPYRLGGWSMGGVVAFEMAQQLTSLGQEVALLALVDSSADIGSHPVDDLSLQQAFANDRAAQGLQLETANAQRFFGV